MPRANRLRDALGEDYATPLAREKGTARMVIADGLAEFTGNPRAKMRWTVRSFCKDVFLAHRVKLVGWPAGVPFVNLSDRAIATAHIRALLHAWERGKMRWAWTTAGERLAALEDARNACPSADFRGSTVHCGRNDIKGRRARPTVDAEKYPPRYVRNGAKSARRVDSDDEDGPEYPVEDVYGGYWAHHLGNLRRM